MKYVLCSLILLMAGLVMDVSAQGSAGGTYVASYGSAGGTYVLRDVHRPQLHLFHRHRSEGSSGGYSYGSTGGTATATTYTIHSYGSSGGYGGLRGLVSSVCPNCGKQRILAVPGCGCCDQCTGRADCPCSCSNCTCKSQPASKPEPPKTGVK